MTSGGSRNRSGPPIDPNSGRSEARGITLDTLPAAGYDGDAPDFPLPDLSVRESEVWAEAWRSPQAAAWAREPWRHRTVALWVRWSVRMEAEDASAALGNVVVRFADQIGMTPAGLRENGWQIAAVDTDKAAAAPARRGSSSRTRLAVVNGGG
jgi:hypothetical protein